MLFRSGSVKWDWTKVHSEVFELCKQVLVNVPICGYAKPGSPYRLYSDPCDFRLAAILQQVLKPAEQNYSPMEREALALKEGLIKFQPYVEGKVILAVTDHAALTWSKTFQTVNHRLLTWGTVFAAYLKLHLWVWAIALHGRDTRPF